MLVSLSWFTLTKASLRTSPWTHVNPKLLIMHFITWIFNFIKIKSHNGKRVQSQPRVCFGSFHKPHETRPTGSLSDQLHHCAWKSTETILGKEGLLNTHYYCFNWLPLHSTPTAFHLDFNAENTLKM